MAANENPPAPRTHKRDDGGPAPATIGPLFSHGRVVTTPGADDLLEETGTEPISLLRRHLRGDWGDVPPEDAKENDFSVEHGFRIISSYPAGDANDKVWIITEADRSSTCFLLPTEY